MRHLFPSASLYSVLAFCHFLMPSPLCLSCLSLPFSLPSFLSIFSPQIRYFELSTFLHVSVSNAILLSAAFEVLVHFKIQMKSILFETIPVLLHKPKQNCRFPSQNLYNACFCYCISNVMAISYLFGGLSF